VRGRVRQGPRRGSDVGGNCHSESHEHTARVREGARTRRLYRGCVNVKCTCNRSSTPPGRTPSPLR